MLDSASYCTQARGKTCPGMVERNVCPMDFVSSVLSARALYPQTLASQPERETSRSGKSEKKKWAVLKS